GREEIGAGDFERPLHGTDFPNLGLRERHVIAEINIRGAARPELMAMRTIHVRIRPGPLVQPGGFLIGITQPAGSFILTSLVLATMARMPTCSRARSWLSMTCPSEKGDCPFG